MFNWFKKKKKEESKKTYTNPLAGRLVNRNYIGPEGSTTTVVNASPWNMTFNDPSPSSPPSFDDTVQDNSPVQDDSPVEYGGGNFGGAGAEGSYDSSSNDYGSSSSDSYSDSSSSDSSSYSSD